MATMHEMNDFPFTEAIGRICNELDIKTKVVPSVQVSSFTATEAHGAVESRKIKTEKRSPSPEQYFLWVSHLSEVMPQEN